MAHFIVAGGGIAGLAAALACAHQGHKVTVLEQAPIIEEIGAGIQIGPNGRRALEGLGVWDLLRPRVVFPRAIRILRAKGGALAELPLSEPFQRMFDGTYQVVHRADLLDALFVEATQRPLIRIHTGRRVTGFTQDDRGVRVNIEQEEADAEGAEKHQTLTGDFLIGADGIRSRVREGLLHDGPPQFAGHVLYRALVDIDAVPEGVDLSSVHLWLHEGGHVVHYPVAAGEKFNIVAAVNESWESEGWSEPSDGAILRRVFKDVAPALEKVLSLPGQWLRWAGADREPVNTWGKGRVTLIGDAAHPTLPYLASGAVMALEDAVILGRKLAAIRSGEREARDEEIISALRAYEATRQPRTARIVKRSHALGRIYHAGPPLSLARDLFIRARSGTAGLRAMRWLYGWRP